MQLNELTPRQFKGVPPLCARGPLAVPLAVPVPYPQLGLKCIVEHATHYLAVMYFDPDATGDPPKHMWSLCPSKAGSCWCCLMTYDCTEDLHEIGVSARQKNLLPEDLHLLLHFYMFSSPKE